jgi:hypothetical protein
MRVKWFWVALAGFAACSDDAEPPTASAPNAPPDVRITNRFYDPPYLNYRAPLEWEGEDPNGDALRYRYRVDDGPWVETTATSVSFDTITTVLGLYSFTVEAIDSRGLSSEPAFATFTTWNRAPSVWFPAVGFGNAPPDRGTTLHCPVRVDWFGRDEREEALHYQWKLIALESVDVPSEEVFARLEDPNERNFAIPRGFLYSNPSGVVLEPGEWFPDPSLASGDVSGLVELPPDVDWVAFALRATDELGTATDSFNMYDSGGGGNVLIVGRADDYAHAPAIVARVWDPVGTFDEEVTLRDGEKWDIYPPHGVRLRFAWYPLSNCGDLGDAEAGFALDPSCDCFAPYVFAAPGWTPWMPGYQRLPFDFVSNPAIAFHLRARWPDALYSTARAVVWPH